MSKGVEIGDRTRTAMAVIGTLLVLVALGFLPLEQNEAIAYPLSTAIAIAAGFIGTIVGSIALLAKEKDSADGEDGDEQRV